ISDANSEFYRDFWIRKQSGGQRRIVVPHSRLMAVQRWISREILATQQVHEISHAYSKHSSIRKCAEQHVGAGWLVKLDIHDYFESISDRRVYGVFRAIGYQPLVAFELARLCTRVWVKPPNEFEPELTIPNAERRGIAAYERRYMGYLPQGAPTSPMLSNLVSRNLDVDLLTLASVEGMVVTRYADDITFSAPSKMFSRERA
ncbi:reverse transcriptase family protein, partial [Ralstonia pseudosolanacearum]|uniref:reverse transcriptase family protein n=1 Tax=Ralstonia pseudosolanacearum TaxID=1310165 RepID=UPI003CF25F66